MYLVFQTMLKLYVSLVFLLKYEDPQVAIYCLPGGLAVFLLIARVRLLRLFVAFRSNVFILFPFCNDFSLACASYLVGHFTPVPGLFFPRTIRFTRQQHKAPLVNVPFFVWVMRWKCFDQIDFR